MIHVRMSDKNTGIQMTESVEEKKAFCYTLIGNILRKLMDTTTVNNRSTYYGGCLYPPEDRYHIIDSAAIESMKKMERT